MSDVPDRRTFLKGLGALGASGVAAAVPVAPVANTTPDPVVAPALPESVSRAYTFFTAPEAAFIEAAVARLIPADDLTPSGTDCGVAIFIDRQLGSAWGSGDRMYLQGPWQKGTPMQGYQLPMTPAELFRGGIASTNAHCRGSYQKEFDRLGTEQQIQVLLGLEQGRITLDQVPAKEFFNLLLSTSMEGFFADPIYGGNRHR